MQVFFSAILFEPILNAFVFLYNYIGDVGIVITIITVLIKVGLYPLTNKSISAQKSLTDLQPKLEEIKAKHKDNQQVLAQETMKLYKEHKVNPFGSCLPMLVQLPIFFALYYVLRDLLGDAPSFDLLYSFVQNPESINPISLGLFDLSKVSIVLAALAAGTQFFQAKMFSKKKPPKAAGEGGKDEGMMGMMNKQMLYFMPFLTLIIGLQFPGGLTLYWFLSTLITLLQQVFIFKKDKDGPSSGGVIEGELVK